MPIICRYVPNRSGRRGFKCADAGRIAAYAARDQGAKCVLETVLGRLGYKEVFCGVLKALRLLDKLEDKAGTVKILTALASFLAAIATVLRRTGGARFPLFAPLLLIASGASLIIRVIVEFLDEADAIEAFTSAFEDMCSSE